MSEDDALFGNLCALRTYAGPVHWRSEAHILVPFLGKQAHTPVQ